MLSYLVPLALLSLQASGQKPPQEPVDWVKALFPEGFTIRRAREDKNLNTKPALFQFTDPKDGDSSYAIDLGATLTREVICGKQAFNALYSIEVHKNTNIEKEQRTVLAGAALEDAFAFGESALISGIDPRFSADYKHDGVKDAESLVVSLFAPMTSQRLRIGGFQEAGDNRIHTGLGFGLEDEQVFSASSGGDTGHVLRGVGALEVAYYFDPTFSADPKKSDMDERAVVSAEASGWLDLDESDRLDQGGDHHDLLRIGLTLFIDGAKHIGLTGEFVNGEDPTKGQPDQRYLQFGLTFML